MSEFLSKIHIVYEGVFAVVSICSSYLVLNLAHAVYWPVQTIYVIRSHRPLTDMLDTLVRDDLK